MSLEKKKNHKTNHQKNNQNLPHIDFTSSAAVAARWACSYLLIQDHAVFLSLQEILSCSNTAV